MSENKSSATHTKMMPAGKPSTSFITEADKSGDGGLGSEMAEASNDTSASRIVESSKDGMSFDAKEISPQGKPSSSFINTNAVK